MEIRRCQPDFAIHSVVRSFAERRATLGQGVVTAPLPARPDQFIEVYLQDSYGVSHDGGPATTAPETVLVGPQSYRRTRLFLSGNIHVFTIMFQPAGFHALFGLPMAELVNQGATAGDVIGSAAGELSDAIRRAGDFESRAAAARHWIWERMETARPVDQVGRMAAALQRAGGRLRIDLLAHRAGLGNRQFTRRFATQVGLTPKLFARTVRFNAVLSARASAPHASWTELIHEAGYADQSHFVRDCHALAGSTPNDFFPEWARGQ